MSTLEQDLKREIAHLESLDSNNPFVAMLRRQLSDIEKGTPSNLDRWQTQAVRRGTPITDTTPLDLQNLPFDPADIASRESPSSTESQAKLPTGGRSTEPPKELAQPPNADQDEYNQWMAGLTELQLDKLAHNLSLMMKAAGKRDSQSSAETSDQATAE